MAPLEFRLLNDFQRRFPLVAQPYAVLAEALGTDEAAVIESLAQLRATGALSRIGAVFRPGALAASTLAAMEVPAARLEAVAAVVSAFAGVNHNYEREHRLNLWFVATAADDDALDGALARITRLTGIGVLKLPLREEYHIDLGFPLDGGDAPRTPGAAQPRRVALDATERRLIAAIENGLALESRPYAALGAHAGFGEQAVIDRLARWQSEGLIRRFGVVVRHHELGWRANAMVVWDVPDADVARFGERLAGAEGVTLAYRRERGLPGWPYNLYCMVHGIDRIQVTARLEGLNRELGLDAFPRAVLFSRTRFKQTGPRFSSALEAIHG